MTTDTRTPAEIAYDLISSGAAYVKPSALPTACDHILKPLISAGLSECTLCNALVQEACDDPIQWAFNAGAYHGAREGIRIYREGHRWDRPPAAPATPWDAGHTAGMVAGLAVIERVLRAEQERRRAAKMAIEVTHLYHNPNQGGDITDQPLGPLSCTDYALGDTFLSFDAEGGGAQVSLFGHDPVDLDRLERTLDNLLALLADPRVKAARGRAA